MIGFLYHPLFSIKSNTYNLAGRTRKVNLPSILIPVLPFYKKQLIATPNQNGFSIFFWAKRK
jgi:hypothetical protein